LVVPTSILLGGGRETGYNRVPVAAVERLAAIVDQA
jgi:hypothetical protein